MPPIAEKGKSTAGEGASGESASSQGGGRVTDLDSESNLDMTRVGPVHDLLLEERLEEEREWLDELQDWFEERGLRVK